MFSRLFQENSKLKALKDNLKAGIADPIEFKCAYTNSFLEWPILSHCGHCFNQVVISGKVISQCPIDHKPLSNTPEHVIEQKRLKSIFKGLYCR